MKKGQKPLIKLETASALGFSLSRFWFLSSLLTGAFLFGGLNSWCRKSVLHFNAVRSVKKQVPKLSIEKNESEYGYTANSLEIDSRVQNNKAVALLRGKRCGVIVSGFQKYLSCGLFLPFWQGLVHCLRLAP
jgi:hypothetical protein